MPVEPFHAPHVTINRVYTRHGDGGETRLVGGQPVPKDDARLEAYGTIDELNAVVGLARVSIEELCALTPAVEGAPAREGCTLAGLSRSLLRVQHELFNLGSLLATLPEDLHEKQPRVTDAEVRLLELEIDAWDDLPTLRSFVLPGGCRANAELHLARTVCRRAERLLVHAARRTAIEQVAIRYVNRLSDALFVWSRAVSSLVGAPEVLWSPNEAATASHAAARHGDE
jgi:cob(I)alamin adenosyltransferase